MTQKIKRQVRLIAGPSQLRLRIGTLIRQPIFLFVTIWGHSVIVFGTIGMFYFENGANQKVRSLFDCLYWAIATVSMVGDGNLSPITLGGRIVAMVVMILGSLFLWSYTALFVGWLIAPEIRQVEKEVRGLEGEVSEVERELKWDQRKLEKLLTQLDKLLNDETLAQRLRDR